MTVFVKPSIMSKPRAVGYRRYRADVWDAQPLTGPNAASYGLTRARAPRPAARGSNAPHGCPKRQSPDRPNHKPQVSRRHCPGRWDRGGAHLARVGVAPGKDIGHPKSAKPQGPRPPFAALNRGVVLHLGGGGGVEHNKAQPRPERIPHAGQGIAIPLAVGIDRDAGRIIL